MNITVKILFVIIIYVLFSSVLKTYRPEYVFFLRLAAIFLVMYLAVEYLAEFISSCLSLFSSFEIDSSHISLLIKVVGISILTDIISDNLKDNNEQALSSIVTLTSKFIILYLTLPVLNGIIIFCQRLMEQ